MDRREIREGLINISLKPCLEIQYIKIQRNREPKQSGALIKVNLIIHKSEMDIWDTLVKFSEIQQLELQN